MLRVISVESGKYVVETIFKLIHSDFYESLYFISWIHDHYISIYSNISKYSNFFTNKLLTSISLFDAERYITKHKLNHM